MKLETITTLGFKVVSNLRGSWLMVLGIMGGLSCADSLFAAVSKSKKAPAVPSGRKVKKTGKTVGDLLQKIQAAPKGKDTKLSFGLSRKSLPQTEKAAAHVEKKNFQEIKPPKSLKFFKSDDTDENRLEKLVDDEINELFKLTQKYATSSNRGELWLRLAELYVEKARLVEFRLQGEFDRKIGNWEKNKRRGPKPELNLAFANSFNQKAIQLYEWFIKDFPSDPRGDQAYFFLGYNYFELNNVKKGEAYYQILVQKYPNSPYVTESNFALGEFYFENEKWADALKHYGKVIKEKESRVRSFAYYKAAWCNYRIGKTGLAMKIMEYVIRSSRIAESQAQQGRLKNVNRIRLAQEALRDIVPFYAETSDHTQAKAYFRKVAGEKMMPGMMERLGYLLSDLGKRDASLYIFKELIAMDTLAPKAFDYQYQIVQNYQAADKEDTFRKELFVWIEHFGPESEWAKANQQNKEILDKAFEVREKTLRNYILALHQAAQNTKNPALQAKAREGYGLYMKTFNDGPFLADMHFFFAELLYDLKDFATAGIHYQWVTDNAPKSKYHEDAILNTLLALEKALPPENEIREKVGETLQPVPFGQTEERFVATGTKYVEAYGKSEKSVEVRFKVARLHYTYNHLDEAIKGFEFIVRHHPKTQSAVFSANLILDIHNLRKDYLALAKSGREFMAIPALAQAGFDVDVKGIVEKAGFKQAQDQEVAKDYAGSGKSFETFVEVNPGSKLVASALFNGAVNYERAGKTSAAVKMYERLLNSHDKEAEPLKPKTRKLLARLYEKTGQFEKAAHEFELIAKENPKDKVAADSYYNAAVVWDGMNKIPQAVANYEKFYETSRKRDRIEAFYKIGEMYERDAKFGAAGRYYERYLNEGAYDPEHVVLVHLKMARFARRAGRHQDADKWNQKTVAVHRRLAEKAGGVGNSAGAEARFNLVQNTMAEFRSIKIPNNPANQEKAVARKLALLDRLNKELGEVIKYDDGVYIVASLALLGMAYDHMSVSLYQAPVPADLKEDDRKLYEAEVDKIASPLRQKAIENYRASLDKAYQIDAYTEWTSVARDGLGRYDPSAAIMKSETTLPVAISDGLGV